jgi:hypothetical protein
MASGDGVQLSQDFDELSVQRDDVCFAHLHSLCRNSPLGLLALQHDSDHSATRSSVGLTKTYGASLNAATIVG